MNDQQREQQIAQAEEMLGEQLEKRGFVKELYYGRYRDDYLPPYPDVEQLVPDRVADLKAFLAEKVDPVAIDREACIPDEVVQGLGKLGILGACLPAWCGGLELSQAEYCRLLEAIGGHCAGTALFVNAHHSIGPRSLVLFGNESQQKRWLPKLATGEWISAFALTEPEAGSDAANVQSRAVPSDDGSHYVLSGEKRWITNGGIAEVLTVMARTPVPGKSDTAVTAFIVTRDMPGFEVLEERMEKCGVRGTVTSRLKFNDVEVPAENILGKLGKGLRVALTVLDFGRTTFGATCTGVAKQCVAHAAHHAATRVQFQKPIGSFELVKQKLAYLAGTAYAIEACTYQTAAFIDVGNTDFMLETAILKVFATEHLWRMVYETFQIHGGLAYFTDQPFERMMRDARINTIGEGANEVLRAFIALAGMRDVGLELEAVLNGLLRPVTGLGVVSRFAARKIGSVLTLPAVLTNSGLLEKEALRLAKRLREFGHRVEWLLRKYQMEIVDSQYQLGRVADAVCDLYASVCVLRRLDAMLQAHHRTEVEMERELTTGRFFLMQADRRMRHHFRAMTSHIDRETTVMADQVLREFG